MPYSEKRPAVSESLDRIDRAFLVCTVAFLVLAASIALVIGTGSVIIVHGWWLVAYLGLVGGVAQLLLGPGLMVVAKRSCTATFDMRQKPSAFMLWNVGTIIVAVADLARSPGAVLGGSVLLVISLVIFAVGLRDVGMAAQHRTSGWRLSYGVLLIFLAVSTVIGTILAYKGRH